jgi:dTDP-4-dehydrorhamnose reductase
LSHLSHKGGLVSELELWGGIECTVNRVHGSYHNQLELTGHDQRLEDLDAVAHLGIRTLRYPVLWELNGSAGNEWRWAAERLGRLRDLKITPIVGLLHHGSGPPTTDLLHPDFAASFARYAALVASRFPWVESYTPINEPLTTARFSALYGLWHPHRRDDHSFVTALLNQCQATVMAMREIRKVNPRAKLIQTEDLGKVHCDEALRYQADFENERRWLTWDLLCGRIDRSHYLWGFLRASGASEHHILWFQDNPCVPELIGINHYATSDRYLYERYDLLPERYRAHNSMQAYGDIEAVRVPMRPAELGIKPLLVEAWQRYRRPLAVTEAHLGCSREEQMRWLWDTWLQAAAARDRGIDVRAVTQWALFGTYDWNTLLTRFEGYYEPGAFDVRGSRPRKTALGELAADIIDHRTPRLLPLLRLPGWWKRPSRVLDSLQGDSSFGCDKVAHLTDVLVDGSPPALVLGGTGTLGHAFGQICEERGIPCVRPSRRQVDITEMASVISALDSVRPWAVINAAGFVAVDDAERAIDRCDLDNRVGPLNLAKACSQRGIPLVTFSSDLVFDGKLVRPYVESDLVRPVNEYGRSKARAEAAVLRHYSRALIVRTSAFFGPWDKGNFVTATLESLAAGRAVQAADDVAVSPTYVPDLVHACLDLLIDGEGGIWHLANPGAISWADLAALAAARSGISARSLVRTPRLAMGYIATRPYNSSLSSERGIILPPLASAIDRYAQARAAATQATTPATSDRDYASVRLKSSVQSATVI